MREKKIGQISCFTKLPKSKISLLNVAFSLGAGPQSNPTVKLAKHFFIFNIFKGCVRNKICSLVCLKAKKEEKLKKMFSFDLVKNSFAYFY